MLIGYLRSGAAALWVGWLMRDDWNVRWPWWSLGAITAVVLFLALSFAGGKSHGSKTDCYRPYSGPIAGEVEVCN